MPAPATIIQRGLRFLNLNKIKVKAAKSPSGIGLSKDMKFPVWAKSFVSTRVSTRTVDIAPRISPAVAGLRVLKASFTILNF